MRIALLIAPAIGCSFPGGSSQSDPPLGPDASVDAPRDDAGNRADWFDSSYRARRLITVANTGPEALEGFPLAVRFDASERTRFGVGGEQLRFRSADDSIDLPFEVEVAGDEALAWVRVNLAADSQATLRMYYDNPSAQAAASASATFSGYAGVYHLSGDFDAAGNAVTSSTGQFDLSVVVNLSVADRVKTEMGSGLSIGADVNEYLETGAAVGAFLPGDAQRVAYEAWFKTPPATLARNIIDNTNTTCRGTDIYISAGDSLGSDGALVARFLTSNNCQGGLRQFVTTTAFRVDDDLWHHLVFDVDRAAGTLELFLDGVSVSTETGVDKTGATGNRATRVGNSTLSSNDSFGGELDEIRIGPKRSADWYRATYQNNVADSEMVVVGGEELF